MNSPKLPGYWTKESTMNNNTQIDLETPAISALAAASKTPFLTAFKVTLGIGLARFALFAGVVTVLVVAYKVLN
jgi:hypothetical protein